ncbi:MAG: FG-GAP repeat domain-containing protein, partial [Pirellulales bacterium]
DAEADATPSAAADGDGSDEDGVTFGTIRVGALGAELTVRVEGGTGQLDGWIDFDGDGNWGGPGEQVFDDLPLNTGEHVLRFDVPSWAVPGTTFARFRISTAGNLGIGGSASDGEVEDYRITLLPPRSALGVFSTAKTITAAIPGSIRSLFATDVDGDGDIDLLSASYRNDTIAWHENDGTGNFTTHVIATDADGASSLFAADLDGDGDTDVLSASRLDGKVAWYENDGAGGFNSHTIDTDADGATSVFAADLDGDGDTDVLSTSLWAGNVTWYENDGEGAFTLHTIATEMAWPSSVVAVDMDGDGDMDVLVSLSGEGRVLWYENDGNEAFTPRTVADSYNESQGVFAADLDGDGDMDVMSGAGRDGEVAWYENDGQQQFAFHSISVSDSWLGEIRAVDMDGDGDIDALGADGRWYENDGRGDFALHTISYRSLPTLFAADMDADGDMDVLGTGYDSSITTALILYENLNGSSGDTDLDGDTDFDDIEAFTLGLHDAASYEERFDLPPAVLGDVNRDGDLDADDIWPFAQLLGGELPAVDARTIAVDSAIVSATSPLRPRRPSAASMAAKAFDQHAATDSADPPHHAPLMLRPALREPPHAGHGIRRRHDSRQEDRGHDAKPRSVDANAFRDRVFAHQLRWRG